MPNTLETLMQHRSIRTFLPDPVPADDLRAAVAAGQTASTSSAVQAYCALRITGAETRAAIAELTGPQEKVRLAPEFLVICGDTRRHRLAAQRDGNTYDTRLEAFLVAAIDASLFAEKMVIALESMGYGICYIGGLRNNLPEVDRLLNLPEGIYPLYGLCIGRPAQDPGTRPRLPVDSVLFDDAYPDDDASLAMLASYDAIYERYLKERGTEPKKWSAIMGAKYQTAARAGLAAYYAGKGARLD
ncbi:MAG: nitroreductase family protein [Planctomycetota bacterium]